MSIYNNRLYLLLKNIYYKVLISFSKKNGVAYEVNGFHYRMPVSCYKYFRARYFPKDYEADNFEFFKKVKKDGATCLDIGAHIGLYSIFMSKEANSKVYAFEPTPSSGEVFRDMVAVNKLSTQVELIPAAVSDKAGKATFYVNDAPLSVSNSIVAFSDAKQDHRNGYEVEVVSIDEFVQQRKIAPGFIKIDAEGAELQVLKGGRNTFLTLRPSGILGLHPFAYTEPKSMLTSIWEILNEFKLDLYFEGEKLSEDRFKNDLMNRTEVFDIQFVG